MKLNSAQRGTLLGLTVHSRCTQCGACYFACAADTGGGCFSCGFPHSVVNVNGSEGVGREVFERRRARWRLCVEGNDECLKPMPRFGGFVYEGAEVGCGSGTTSGDDDNRHVREKIAAMEMTKDPTADSPKSPVPLATITESVTAATCTLRPESPMGRRHHQLSRILNGSHMCISVGSFDLSPNLISDSNVIIVSKSIEVEVGVFVTLLLVFECQG